MLKNRNKLIIVWVIIICGAIFSSFIQPKLARAELLDDWKHPDAYRSKPILFLHGFGKGGPQTWTGEEGIPSPEDIDKILNPYFKEYYTRYNPIDPTKPDILEDTEYPYLEVISFIDEQHTGNSRQELIDRNSSIDTYKAGDYYVSTNERNIGDHGWSDKVKDAVSSILNGYSTDKAVLVCHSMGGLAAREYFSAFFNVNGGVDFKSYHQ